MSELMSVPVPGGGALLVEVTDDEPGMARASRVGDTIEAAAVSLASVLQPIRQVAEEARDAFREAGPDEIEMEFGVKLTAEAGAILARAGTEGHLKVKLVWRREGTSD
jgi:hypothetical protein